MTSYTAQFKANQAKAAPAKPASRVKRAVVNNIEDVTPKPTLSESIHDDIKGLFAKYKVTVPSTTRFIISIVAVACVGLGIGYIGSVIVETLVISALMLTNSLFIGMAMYILGVLATMYASFKLGGFVGNYILSGDIDRSYQKYSNLAVGFFSFGNREVTS